MVKTKQSKLGIFKSGALPLSIPTDRKQYNTLLCSVLDVVFARKRRALRDDINTCQKET